MAAQATLSKSKYVAGRQCEKRLWLQCHGRDLATPPDAARRAIFETGAEVGRCAHRLFPGGVEVTETPWQHAGAVRRTRELMEDPRVPAIFEAAFEHERVRIRVDVLERLPDSAWGLREVKSTTSAKPVHREDLAVQAFVLEGCGLTVPSLELVHIDRGYVRGDDGIDWERFFVREELAGSVRSMLDDVATRVDAMNRLVRETASPEVEPSRHCREPVDCEFWEHCTRNKPSDWIYRLPRLRAGDLGRLRDRGVERITEIPDDFPLSEIAARARAVLRSGTRFRSADLANALGGFGPPAFYLDFETLGLAVPLYPGTRPYAAVPFQWSLHRIDAAGNLSHREFLADGASDPRREFAERLLAALDGPAHPIVVYSGFENTVLGKLCEALPDLAPGLQAIRGRLVDLLPVVREHVYDSGFQGSFSIKSVGPALAPGFGYGDLAEVAEGSAASAAFGRLAAGRVEAGDEAQVRKALLDYCERDTRALVEVHRVLRS